MCFIVVKPVCILTWMKAMETSRAKQHWANHYNVSHFPLFIVWENCNNICSAKTCLHSLRPQGLSFMMLREKTCKFCSVPYKYLLLLRNLKRSTLKELNELRILFTFTFDLSTVFFFFFKQAVKPRGKKTAVNTLYIVYDTQHKQVNASRINVYVSTSATYRILSTESCWVLEKDVAEFGHSRT